MNTDDATLLGLASAMADSLGDGSWQAWSQEQASEVEDVLDSLRTAHLETAKLRQRVRLQRRERDADILGAQ